MIICWNRKVREDNYEHEYVVDGKCFLNQVASEKLERFLVSEFEENKYIEQKREGDPNGSPAQRLLHRREMRSTLENAEVQRQHQKNEKVKINEELVFAQELITTLRRIVRC